jgi:hypothetical protein
MVARIWGERNYHTLLVGMGCKLVQPLWKTIWRLLKKLNIDLSYNPAIQLLGIYPKEYNSNYYESTCTPMFTEAYLQQPSYGNSQDALQLKNGSRKYGIYTQWNFTQPQRRMTFCQ